MGGIGFEELLLVMIVAIIAYGKELPQVARKLARAYNSARRYMNDVRDEITRQIPDEDLRIDTALPSHDDYYKPPEAQTFEPAKPTSEEPPKQPDSPAGSAAADADPKPAA